MFGFSCLILSKFPFISFNASGGIGKKPGSFSPAIKLVIIKKDKLTKASYFYIVQSKSKFLFIKKPRKGIWGGLWSFLESKEELDIKQWLSNNLKINNCRLLQNGVITSVFTHYRLQMHYQHIEVKDLKSKKTIFEGSWHDKDEIEDGAYPAPVKKILKKLIQR